MIAEAFLICALALPGRHFQHSPMVSYHTSTEEERLIAWIKKNNPDAEVFIHEKPQREKLKEHGWERVPFNYKWREIWIHRKPRSDRKAA